MTKQNGDPDGPWVQPGDETKPVSQSPPSGYGTSASPSYGKYGQGEALPSDPPPPYGSQPSGQPVEGQAAAPGQPSWDQSQYGSLPPWRNTFRASGGLGVAVIALSSLLTLMYWISAVLSPSADRQYEDAVAQGRSATDVFTAYDVVNFLSLPVVIGAWVITCVWLGRARDNALQIQPQGQRRSAVWVWLGWIVPIVSLWFPKQILDDTIKATAPAAGVREPISTGWYWAGWIVMNLLSNAQIRLTFQAKPEDAVIPGLEFTVAIVTTVALVLWVLLVRRISSVQDQLAANEANGR